MPDHLAIPPATPEDLKLDLGKEWLRYKPYDPLVYDQELRVIRLAAHYKQEVSWQEERNSNNVLAHSERITTLEADCIAWKAKAESKNEEAQYATERSARYTIKCAKLEAALREAQLRATCAKCRALTHTEEIPDE